MRQYKYIQCEASTPLQCNTDYMNYIYIVMGHKFATSTGKWIWSNFSCSKRLNCILSIVRKGAEENKSKKGHTVVKIYYAFPS